MQSKVQNYIAGLYRNAERPVIKAQHAFWILLPFVGCGLGAWALFFAGPAKALSAAHAITWCYIVLAALMHCCMAGIGLMRTVIARRNAVLSDVILFANTRTPLVTKITSRIDTPMMAALALLAGWTVAATILVILFALEITTRNIIKINQASRCKELEAVEESELIAALITPEEERVIREQINQIFRKS